MKSLIAPYLKRELEGSPPKSDVTVVTPSEKVNQYTGYKIKGQYTGYKIKGQGHMECRDPHHTCRLDIS